MREFGKNHPCGHVVQALGPCQLPCAVCWRPEIPTYQVALELGR